MRKHRRQIKNYSWAFAPLWFISFGFFIQIFLWLFSPSGNKADIFLPLRLLLLTRPSYFWCLLLLSCLLLASPALWTSFSIRLRCCPSRGWSSRRGTRGRSSRGCWCPSRGWFSRWGTGGGSSRGRLLGGLEAFHSSQSLLNPPAALHEEGEMITAKRHARQKRLYFFHFHDSLAYFLLIKDCH